MSSAEVSANIAVRPHRTRLSSVVRSGLVGGLAAVAAVELYAAAGRAAGVPFRAGFPGAHDASAITAGSFAFGVVLATVWGTIIAGAVARFAAKPENTFTAIAVVVTATSLVTPLAATGATAGTRLALVGAHLLVAAIMTLMLRRGINGAHG